MDMQYADVMSNVFSWLGSVASTIASNRFLLIPFGVAVAGAVVGILKRVFSGGRA